MRTFIFSALIVALTTSVTSIFFLQKKQLKLKLSLLNPLKRHLKQSEIIGKWIERAKFSAERITLVHIMTFFLTLILIIQKAVGVSSVSVFIPAWGLLLPLYGIGYLRNKAFVQDALDDVEEILRVTYLLEKSGTDSRDVNQYLAQTIKGPLMSAMQNLAAGQAVNLDIKEAYQKIKMEFKDIRGVVNYTNICIQKQTTGKSGSLYAQQLQQIKQIKLARYKMKRLQSRIKLCVFAVLLTISFLSVTLYPIVQDTMRTFMGSMSN